MSNIGACVFDAYGTLFDVNAAAREVAEQPGRETFALVWQQVAIDWRTKTLQYTWLRTITGDYVDFWQITQDALDWALAASDQADPELRELLLGLFWSLKSYPDVPHVLAELQRRGIPAAILSNGTPEMIEAAVESAGVASLLSAMLTVDPLARYKPSREVYDLVTHEFDLPPGDVLFVSSNGWDVAGAARYGFRTLWVNRVGEPVDRLTGQPDRIAADLTAVPEML
ncbi:MAG: haloacid dehalogenase type II [Pseudomonadota bacterium]